MFTRAAAFWVERLEDMLVSDAKRLELLLQFLPPALFERISQVKARLAFERARRSVPAYRQFLEENSAVPIRSYRQFVERVPQTDKPGYIQKYSLLDRCVDGRLPLNGSIDESGGSSGQATMWARSAAEEKKLEYLITFALHHTFRSLEKYDLVVLNCWSTGPWATGVKFSQFASQSAIVKTIGTNAKNAVQTILDLGEGFEYLITGYPPFVKTILDCGLAAGLDWTRYRVNFITGGEGFSEGWRRYILACTNGKADSAGDGKDAAKEGKLASAKGGRVYSAKGGRVYSAYGASDVGIGVSVETDLTIAILQQADADLEFRQAIFQSDKMPIHFGQYNPLIYHIENSPTGELLFTTNNLAVCSPKIRYNLKDTGRVIPYAALIQQLRRVRPQLLDQAAPIHAQPIHLPFIIIWGRSDGTISIDGANIYPIDIQDALYRSEYANLVKSFYITTQYQPDLSVVFKVYIELIEGVEGIELADEDCNRLSEIIRDHLLRASKDYRESYENNPSALTPQVETLATGEGIFQQNIGKVKDVLYNKALFVQLLASVAESAHWPVSLIIARLDAGGAPPANRLLGDEAIRRVARVLRRVLRDTDIITRMDENEFVVLLPGTNEPAAARVISRIWAAVQTDESAGLGARLHIGSTTAYSSDLLTAYQRAAEKAR